MIYKLPFQSELAIKAIETAKEGYEPEEHYCYKEQGKPCSCYVCSPYKYKRNVKHKGKLENEC